MNKINDQNDKHICVKCVDFVPDKKVKIGLCLTYNKIIHKDEKMCRIKRSKKSKDK